MKYIVSFFILLSISFNMNAQDSVSENPKDICPILIGEDLPDGTLVDLEKKELSVSKLTKKKKSILIFYRGGWCPYCNTQLSGINEILDDIKELDFQVVAISPDNAEHLKKTIDKEELDYELLSDSKMEYARSLGIAFKMNKKTLKKYKLFGIDLEESSGESHFQLPAPAVFVVDKKGVIQFSYVNPNYKVRLKPEILLSVLRNMD